MAQDDFYNDEDAYRNRVMGDLNPNSGIAGPQEQAPAPQPAAPNPRTYDYEKFRSDWLSGGFNTRVDGGVGSLQNFIATNPYAAGVTLRNEKAYDPSGKFIADMIGDVGGKDSRIFLRGTRSAAPGGTVVSSHAGISPGGGGNLPPGGGGGQNISINDGGAMAKFLGGGGTPGAGTGSGGGPPAANPFLQQIRDLIMGRLSKMSQDPSMSDPALAAQSQAYGRARDRGTADARAAMAERAAANGTLQGGQSSGAFDADLRSIYESAGEDKAANDASLIGAEVQQRRAEVQSLMNMALQSGDAESARALQMQLAQLDAQLRRESLKESARQFNSTDKYRYKALGEQGRQFDDSIGRQYGRDYEDDYRWRVMYGL